ncbi:MAG: hypothetical protein WCP31_00285 [Chloroflexales bacterium]
MITEPTEKRQAHEDPLTTGELRPLKELAEEMSLNYDSLRKYAQKDRLRAVKFGLQWASTRKAIEEYLGSRYDRAVTRQK